MNLDNFLVPVDTVKMAEAVADSLFTHTTELIKWGIAERRRLSCWRAVKLAEIIRLINEERVRRGKRPRWMPGKRRRLINAKAGCKAEREQHRELAIVCRASEERLAELKTRGWA